MGGRAGAQNRVRGPHGAEVAVEGRSGFQAVGERSICHGWRGGGVQEGLVGGVGHHGFSVAVLRETRVAELHAGVVHVQEVVGGQGLVPAWFGHFKALQGARDREEVKIWRMKKEGVRKQVRRKGRKGSKRRS